MQRWIGFELICHLSKLSHYIVPLTSSPSHCPPYPNTHTHTPHTNPTTYNETKLRFKKIPIFTIYTSNWEYNLFEDFFKSRLDLIPSLHCPLHIAIYVPLSKPNAKTTQPHKMNLNSNLELNSKKSFTILDTEKIILEGFFRVSWANCFIALRCKRSSNHYPLMPIKSF